MNNPDIPPIKKELLVEASQMTAFKVFTEKMDLWWPRSHHIGKTPVTESVLEPGVNGRWYTLHEDGSRCDVGHVLEWDPYAQVVLAWQINGNYKYDPNLITEVEVRFIAEGPKTTTVKFEHKNLGRMSGVKAVAEMDYGWGWILQLYKTHIETEIITNNQ